MGQVYFALCQWCTLGNDVQVNLFGKVKLCIIQRNDPARVVSIFIYLLLIILQKIRKIKKFNLFYVKINIGW